jgi:branched-chain amino acid transport system substrate-binding protein
VYGYPVLARRAALLALSISVTSCSERGPILIGLAGPFSEARGTSMRLAAELAVNEINRTGGINGRDIRLLIIDDSAQDQTAVLVAQELYANLDVVAVVGHLNSGATLAAAPVYNGDPTPLLAISPSASSPELTNAGRYSFRVCPTDLVHGRQLAEWARNELGASRAAVFYRNDDYGRGVRQNFVESFVELGGAIVGQDPYILELPNFIPFLELLRDQGGADVLMIAGSVAGAERVFPTLDSLGLRVQVMGGDGLTGIQDAVGPLAEGVLISTAYLPDRPGEKNATFVSTYRAAYANALPDHRGAGAYDIIHLLAEALKEVGPNRERLRDYVAGIGISRPPFSGVTGAISFDANGDVPTKPVVVGVVRGNRLVTARQ